MGRSGKGRNPVAALLGMPGPDRPGRGGTGGGFLDALTCV